MVRRTTLSNGQIEVLAPAGSFEALVAAAESGADAVYFGGTQFSARQYADNFSNDELRRAIDYLHVRGIQAYVTINTLLYDQEIDEAVRLASSAYSLGADAFIVQDLGLASALRQLLPDVELHASTQMTVHNPQGCTVLSKMGFSRVILARELGMADIEAIREAGVPIDLEVFVHGALCFSYSGQCLMSSMIGGRSGNRGRCAQPCRLEYRLVELDSRRPVTDFRAGAGHLLSPSDLCLIECIPSLVRAGVVALKIEGRMKRPEYVATVTRAYRWAVDAFLESGDIPRDQLLEVMDELSVAFNRGFTKAYFHGHPSPDLMSPGRPSNRGSYIGRVARTIADGSDCRIEFRLEGDLARGDGIEVWVSKGGRAGKKVERLFINGRPVQSARRGDTVQVEIQVQANAGDRVFKTLDARVTREARQAFVSPRAQRQLSVKFEAEARLGRRFVVTATDLDGNSVTHVSDYVVESATRHPTTTDDIRENIARTGNTPFRPERIIVNMDDGVMVPRSVVNESRRGCIERLKARRAESFRRAVPSSEAVASITLSAVGQREHAESDARQDLDLPGVSVSTTRLDGLGELIGARPDRLYLSLECFGRDTDCLWNEGMLEKAIELASESGTEVFVRPSRILKAPEVDMVARRIAGSSAITCPSVSGFLTGSLGMAHAIARELGSHSSCGACKEKRGEGRGLAKALQADYTIGIANSMAVTVLRGLGFAGVTASPELSLSQVGSLLAASDLPVEVVVHGRLPLMVSEQCVAGYLSECDRLEAGCRLSRASLGLLDRKGYVFPVSSDQFCRTHVFNSMCLCMLDSIDDIGRLSGIGLYRIEGYGQTNAELARTVSAYKKAISGAAGRLGCKDLGDIGESGFTRGHFYRGAE